MHAVAQRSVLVVESDPMELSQSVRLLQEAGYRVASASAFDEAKQKLASDSPDLLIAGLRLGPYNGLHLVLRSRMDHPEMAAIITSRFPDAVLEAEAMRYKAAYLVRPLDDDDFLKAIAQSLSMPLRNVSREDSPLDDRTA